MFHVFFFRAWFVMGFGMGFEIKAVAFIGRFWVFWPIWFEQSPPRFGFFSSRLPSGDHTKNYGKSQFMVGKLSISMAMCNSCLYTRPGSL
jgi:hypothetical protein